MGIFRKIKNAISTQTAVTLETTELARWLGIHPDRGALSEVTYFTCLKMLSETMGKLPLKFYQDTKEGRIRAEPSEMYRLMSVRPNPFMTPSTFWASVELNAQHTGNGLVYIQQKYIPKKFGADVKPVGLWIMPSADTDILIDDKGIFGDVGKMYYRYTDKYTHETYIYDNEEVMHFKTWLSFDGFTGQPVKEILRYTVKGASESQKYMNKLYEQGLTASMALNYTGDLDDKRQKALAEKYEKKMNGAENTGKVIPVPVGIQLTPLNVKMTDAQFFELKKYSALQIAGAFGIKPNQINNYEKSSYSNSESQNLSFLVDTMSARIKQYEEEINAKCLTQQEIREGKFFKFNENAILRTDSKTKRENVCALIDKGVYTINQAKDFYDLPHVEGGDETIVNGTYIPLTQVGKQYE